VSGWSEFPTAVALPPWTTFLTTPPFFIA
jgi:hypothetical protein